VTCESTEVNALILRTTTEICAQLNLVPEDIVVDVSTPRMTDSVWHIPDKFPGTGRHATEKKLSNISIQKDSCRLAFFTLKEVNDVAFKRCVEDAICR
jgi:hypothetical protein